MQHLQDEKIKTTLTWPAPSRDRPGDQDSEGAPIASASWSDRRGHPTSRWHGTYGYCEETGEPIALKRLEARPLRPCRWSCARRGTSYRCCRDAVRPLGRVTPGRLAKRLAIAARGRAGLPSHVQIWNAGLSRSVSGSSSALTRGSGAMRFSAPMRGSAAGPRGSGITRGSGARRGSAPPRSDARGDRRSD